ncbi:MAG: hypothetical protein AAGC81_05205 [Pseudomonadota bacterium]
MHVIWKHLVFVGLSILMSTGALQAQEDLNGRFFGVDDGRGAIIDIAPDAEGYVGTFFDAAGNQQSFEADRVGVIAESVLDMGGQTVLIRIQPRPYGAEVSLIPFDDEGRLVFASAREVTFLREGLTLPEPPPDYVDPPSDARGRLAASSFLVSYAFWAPEGVLNGYLSLAPRSRTLISLFATVQLDVIFKLCLADQSDAALAIALRGQGVTCDEVISGMAAAQRSGSFQRFKDAVTRESAILKTSMRCADNYVASKEICDAVAADVSRQAVSLQTASTVLQAYR